MQRAVELPTKAAAPISAQYCMHPLGGSVATVDRAVDWMSFRLQGVPCAGWTPCEQALSDPEFFSRWRASVAGFLGERYTDVPERTTAGYVLQWYLGIPAYLGALLFHSARRVPSLAPRQLAFRFDRAWVQEVALRPGPFWCLPADPDAEHPDAVVAPDEAALGALLRREVVSHAARFLRVYSPLVRFGRRTLWAAVTDVLDTALLLAGRSFGSTQAGAADARLVLPERVEPLTSASTICTVTDDDGRTHWTRRRGSCCFYYALSGVEHPCATCPRTDDEGRARILGARDHP
ncbi:MAG: (2Fe-2S)-binding protein [Pseudonocardiaceae bacterium]